MNEEVLGVRKEPWWTGGLVVQEGHVQLKGFRLSIAIGSSGEQQQGRRLLFTLPSQLPCTVLSAQVRRRGRLCKCKPQDRSSK
jgi:hypothetical protein